MERLRRFTGRQVTTMVVAVCVTAILAPIGALAATGQLVNITDPSNASHKAGVNGKGGLLVTPRDPVSGRQVRVTNTGALRAASIAGVPAKPVNAERTGYGNGRVGLVDTPYGKRLAVTQVTMSYLGTGVATVDLWDWTVASTVSCASATSGSPLVVVRRVYLAGNTTIQLDWTGAALLMARPASGKRQCLVANITGSSNRISFGVTGYNL